MVTVNGVIAGVSQTEQSNVSKPADFWSTLPPQLFRRGHNTVAIYEVTGTPAAPHLDQIRLS